jgi:hypothetical protein
MDAGTLRAVNAKARELDRRMAIPGGGVAVGRGRLTRRLSSVAFFNAWDHTGGTKCPREEFEKYLQDNERLYLGVNRQQTGAGLRNRFGRVKERIVYPDRRAG